MFTNYIQQLYFNLYNMHIGFPTYYQERFGYLDRYKFK